ncbi:MAG: amidohydrolase family protein [Acidobacteria bacterium]|nr:amidohydrolase family protein [Acidobacteriota bacterium]MBI3661829.1 amidohydrolase family protein [Acidobacteriota bacterium]
MVHRSVRRAWSGIVAAALIAAMAVGPLGVPVARAQARGIEPPYFAIQGAKIVTVSGGVIENGTVVVAHGLIAAVGADAKIPPEAWVIDGKGLTVYPGLIDAMTDVGLPAAPPGPPGAGGPAAAMQQAAQQQQRPSMGPEDRPGTTPWRAAADELQPAERRIEQWRNAGFTTVLCAPKTGIFPGQGAVIDLAGERPGEMVVKTPATLHITLQQPGGFFGFPGSLFGVIAYIKQIFLDAAQARAVEEIYNVSPKGVERLDYDRATRVLNGALRANRPVLFPATTPTQIVRALELNEQLKTNMVLYGAQQGYEPAAASAIAAKKVPVLVSLKWPEKDKDADPDAEEPLRTLRFRDKAPSTPAALEKAGVKFAFYSDGIANPKDILKNAKKAIDAGLKAESALRAFTLGAAEILGVADRLGSIEAGKIANLVVTDGDLFGDKMRVKYVFVDGRKFDVKEQAPPPGGAGAAPPVKMAGKWSLNVVTPDGDQPATADLTQAVDGTLSGTITTTFGTSTITKGSVTSNQFTFTFPLDIGQGPGDVTMSGTVEGNTLKGTASAFGQTFELTGTKPGSGQSEAEEVRR